ncbi:hypothetical protein CBR_g32121 [Chara braunii]|uniref:Reverse transcriptase domain-containing protein n=1 Tax=Chara braunii TaxID=69332 RepID=A0A388LGK8_CHABU|nr:hypothetical protein CBR_g32121 [Chara braunii]|eukprot:GBG81444.1 hypothetical protein CBR_g32121 [Chara braunii]
MQAAEEEDVEEEERLEAEEQALKRRRMGERGESSGTKQDDLCVEKKISEWVANLSLGEDEEAMLYVPQEEKEAAAREIEAASDPLERQTIENEKKLAREKKRRMEEANRMASEVESLQSCRQEVEAQPDIQAKLDKILGSIELLGRAWTEHHQSVRGQDMALHSIRTGFREFARDVVTHVGTEVRRLKEGADKFCAGAIDGAKVVAASESEGRTRKEPVKLKFPDSYGGKKEENFDNWEASVNNYVYLQHILPEEQVLVAFHALKDEVAMFCQWKSARALKEVMDDLVAISDHGITETQLVNLFYRAMPEPLRGHFFFEKTQHANITYDALSTEVVLFEAKSAVPVSTFLHKDLDEGKKWKGLTVSGQVRAKDHLILTLDEGGTDEVPYSQIEWGLEENDSSVGQGRTYAVVGVGGRPQGRGGGQSQGGRAMSGRGRAHRGLAAKRTATREVGVKVRRRIVQGLVDHHSAEVEDHLKGEEVGTQCSRVRAIMRKEQLEEQVFKAYARLVTEPKEDEPMNPTIAKLLEEFKDLAEPPTGVVSWPIQHRIEIEAGSRTPKGAVYTMSPRELEELRKQLDELLEMGGIRPSSSLLEHHGIGELPPQQATSAGHVSRPRQQATSTDSRATIAVEQCHVSSPPAWSMLTRLQTAGMDQKSGDTAEAYQARMLALITEAKKRGDEVAVEEKKKAEDAEKARLLAIEQQRQQDEAAAKAADEERSQRREKIFTRERALLTMAADWRAEAENGKMEESESKIGLLLSHFTDLLVMCIAQQEDIHNLDDKVQTHNQVFDQVASNSWSNDPSPSPMPAPPTPPIASMHWRSTSEPSRTTRSYSKPPRNNWSSGFVLPPPHRVQHRARRLQDIQMGFKAVKHYFITRSFPALGNALTHVEDTLTTTTELFDKAAQIIVTNKEVKNLNRSFATGPSRDQHRPKVAVVAAATPTDPSSEAVPANEGDRLAAARDGGRPDKGRGRGKTKTNTASIPGPGATAPAPWSNYGLSEHAYKLRTRFRYCLWCNRDLHDTVTALHSEAHAEVNSPSLLYSYEYAARLVPMQGTHAQGQDVCAASSPSGSGDLSSSSGSSWGSAREFNIEVLDPLTSEDFAWLPLPTTGRLSGPQCATLCAHLHMYLSFYAPPTSPTDDEAAVGVILAYVIDPRVSQAEFTDIFKSPTGVVPDRPISHEIILEAGVVSPKGCIYCMSEEELTVLRAQLDDLLDKDSIRPSSSPHGAPVLFVRKKNKDLRLCIDYRKLNAQTVKNAGPLPRIDDLLERLGGAKYFSELDLKSGYHQISIRPNDRYKSAFKSWYGHFEWVVMPFGLTNAPTTFQAAMTNEFRVMLDRFVLVYLDNILVYSRTLEDHLEHLRRVLETLRSAKYKANRDKCEFIRQEMDYLGHFVTPEGISPLLDKIQAIQEWSAPWNVMVVRSFLGLAGYYKRFIKGYSKIAAHLIKLQCGIGSSTSGRMRENHSWLSKLHYCLRRSCESMTCYCQRASLWMRPTTTLVSSSNNATFHPRLLPSDKYANCSSPNLAPSHYWIQEGYLLVHKRGKDLLCVPSDSHLRTRLLGEFHDAPATGHFGVNRTIGRLCECFWWPDLLDDVTRYCDSCEVCLRCKSRNHRLYGELRPLPVPLRWTEAIAMDITRPFPKHKTGVDGILTVVDRLTKFAMFLPCRNHAKAPELAEVLYADWIRTKGYPKTDGQRETAHQTAQVLLRTLIRPNQKDWVERLPNIELAYNSSIHPAIRMSPFKFEHASPFTSPLDTIIP